MRVYYVYRVTCSICFYCLFFQIGTLLAAAFANTLTLTENRILLLINDTFAGLTDAIGELFCITNGLTSNGLRFNQNFIARRASSVHTLAANSTSAAKSSSVPSTSASYLLPGQVPVPDRHMKSPTRNIQFSFCNPGLEENSSTKSWDYFIIEPILCTHNECESNCNYEERQIHLSSI